VLWLASSAQTLKDPEPSVRSLSLLGTTIAYCLAIVIALITQTHLA
jgi:hypothetical protein